MLPVLNCARFSLFHSQRLRKESALFPNGIKGRQGAAQERSIFYERAYPWPIQKTPARKPDHFVPPKRGSRSPAEAGRRTLALAGVPNGKEPNR